MKNLIIILFFICAYNVKAVEVKENVVHSMLQQNFKLFLIEDKRLDSTYYENLNKANKIECPKEYIYVNNTYFDNSGYLHDFHFKDTINGIKVNYIDLRDYMSFKKILKPKKDIMSLCLIKIEKNDIYFKYMLCTTTLKNKYNYEQVLYAWFNCHYYYDCNTKDWILINAKLDQI